MNTSMQYFMTVVQEQSIVRAAEKLYISPQNLSNHIRRLEQQYGTLFTRAPRFRLTMAGEALARTIQQISILEQGLEVQLDEIRQDKQGHLRVGVHATRARILMPNILQRFWSAYPGVTIDFFYQDMFSNERMLLNGEIDFFFGVDPRSSPDFARIHLCNEPSYLVTSVRMLRERGVVPVNGLIALKDLTRFDYVLPPTISRFRSKIDRFCDAEGITLPILTQMSDFELQLLLSARSMCTCFCPQMFLRRMEEINHLSTDDNHLCAFRVEHLDEMTELSLVYHRLAYRSRIMDAFIAAFIAEFSQADNEKA